MRSNKTTLLKKFGIAPNFWELNEKNPEKES